MNRQQRRRRERAGATAAASRNTNWMWWITLGMVGVVVVVLIVLTMAGVFGEGGGSSDLSAGQIRDLKAESHLVGDPNAPVEIIEFADYQCPYCKQFWETTYQRLMIEFVQTGQVAFYFHNMAFLGQESILAASAAECAAEQGKFEGYHGILFAQQGPENRGYITTDQLELFGQTAGLEPVAFSSCVMSGKYIDTVNSHTNNASSVGVHSTPTLFVAGNKMNNALNYTEVRAAVLEALGD